MPPARSRGTVEPCSLDGQRGGRRASALVLVWALVTGPSAFAWAWPADGPVLRGFSVGGDAVRRRPASRDRRGARGICSGSRTGRGRGDVRRCRSDERPDGDDRRRRRQGLADPPGHAARAPRRRRLGGRRPRRSRPYGRRRARRSVRPPRRPRRPGRVLRRPAHPPSASARLPPSFDARGAARTTVRAGALTTDVGCARESGGHAPRHSLSRVGRPQPRPSRPQMRRTGSTPSSANDARGRHRDQLGTAVRCGEAAGALEPPRGRYAADEGEGDRATARGRDLRRRSPAVSRPYGAVPSARLDCGRLAGTPTCGVRGSGSTGRRPSEHPGRVEVRGDGTDDDHPGRPSAPVAALVAALAACGLGAWRVARKGLPIIGARDRAGNSEEDPGRGRVAVCQRPPAHRPCRGLRRPVGHLRALSPAPRERRPDGQRHGRTRHAGHGRGGRGRRVAA